MSAWMVIITWDERAKSAKTLFIKSFNISLRNLPAQHTHLFSGVVSLSS